jgi:5-methylcytosine-specific restriction enzyme subunit McrC
MAVFIPMRNIWWLMMFASDSSGIVLSTRRGREDIEEDLPDLVSTLICDEVSRRFRQKLSVDYETASAELYRVRGRIDFLKTARKSLLARGKVAVNFSRITHDNDVNRLALHALNLLSKIVSKSKQPAVKSAIQKLEISGVKQASSSMQVNQVFAKAQRDLKLVSLSKLAVSLQLITEQHGSDKFFDVEKEPSQLRKLFEAAIAGFYKYHLKSSDWRVSGGRKFPWNLSDETDGFKALMPQMVTDIEIEHAPTKSKLIIDTKFTSVLAKGYWKETFKSDHFYQLNAYLDASKQVTRSNGETLRIEGMLLYPSVGADFTESAVLDGSRLRICTVNLDGKPEEISKRLLSLVSLD